eukprot:5263093-Prymnesium_polylepis.2
MCTSGDLAGVITPQLHSALVRWRAWVPAVIRLPRVRAKYLDVLADVVPSLWARRARGGRRGPQPSGDSAGP